MESIIYFIQKFSDTFILPAVTSTFIALIYFSYKWSVKNLRNKPLTIFNIFYVGDDKIRESPDSNVLTEPVIPITFQPVPVPTPALSQLRNKSFSVKMLPEKLSTKFYEVFSKLQYCNSITHKNIYTYPVYNVWKELENSTDLVNLKEEILPLWDYYDVTIPRKNLAFRNRDKLSYNTIEGNFDYCHSKKYKGLTQNTLNKELIMDITSEDSGENVNYFEASLGDKQSLSLKDCYRLYYDTENEYDSLNDISGKATVKQLNSECENEVLFENSMNENESLKYSKNVFEESKFTLIDRAPCNYNAELLKNNNSMAEPKIKNIKLIHQNEVDESDLESVDLTSYNYNEELLKKDCFTIEPENIILSGGNFEDYWEIV